jgi:hypothetical protein
LLVLSHKLNQALVVVAVVLVVALAVVAVVIALAVAAVVMAPVLVLSRALAVVVAVAAVAVHRTHILHALPTPVLRALLIHVQRVLLTPVLPALPTHVQQAHVLLSQNLAANAETLAVAKHESPQSPPFCMESSRFREDSSGATQVAALA